MDYKKRVLSTQCSFDQSNQFNTFSICEKRYNNYLLCKGFNYLLLLPFYLTGQTHIIRRGDSMDAWKNKITNDTMVMLNTLLTSKKIYGN